MNDCSSSRDSREIFTHPPPLVDSKHHRGRSPRLSLAPRCQQAAQVLHPLIRREGEGREPLVRWWGGGRCYGRGGPGCQERGGPPRAAEGSEGPQGLQRNGASRSPMQLLQRAPEDGEEELVGDVGPGVLREGPAAWGAAWDACLDTLNPSTPQMDIIISPMGACTPRGMRGLGSRILTARSRRMHLGRPGP